MIDDYDRGYLNRILGVKTNRSSIHSTAFPSFGRDPPNRDTLLGSGSSPNSDRLAADSVSFSEMEHQKNINEHIRELFVLSIFELKQRLMAAGVYKFGGGRQGDSEGKKTQEVERVDLTRDGFGPLNFHFNVEKTQRHAQRIKEDVECFEMSQTFTIGRFMQKKQPFATKHYGPNLRFRRSEYWRDYVRMYPSLRSKITSTLGVVSFSRYEPVRHRLPRVR
ncbi:hypothetical protein PROFUN_08199 [Planoprotostelium fungivorum]|uniref:Uncharacterized protein n=1 Tax=Planoprotostelium fungivorum TaxID=1890364 RepID=A0A2P6N664_9EUKA|nr:hypothetical protein PROFUN_08199 [Planoprotostelium fungivorum]